MARVALVGRQELPKCCVTVQVFELYRLLDPTKALVCRLSGNSARSLMELCCLQVRYLPYFSFIMGVVLTARSLQRGEEARRVLESEGLRPSLLHLDVDSQQSIQQARDLVKEKYGRLDVLVNNAAVAFTVNALLVHCQPCSTTLKEYTDCVVTTLF